MALGVQRVEGMEELFLGALAAGQELHVVEDQRIDAAELFAKLAHLVAPERTDQLVHENLGRHEQNFPRPIAAGPDVMPDRGHQMRLAEADTAVDEERVVLFARLIGDRLRRGMRELIARADHELRESVARVQGRMAISARRGAVVARFAATPCRCRCPLPLAIAIRMAVAVGMTIGRRCVRRCNCRILAQSQPHLDLAACLRRQRGAHQAHVAIVDPIAKKSIGRLDRDRRSLMSDKIERPDPRLVADLTELIAHAVSGSLPQSIHIVSP